MKHTLLLASLLLLGCIAQAQTSQLFQPGIISNNGIFGFTLSPDGKTAFWVRSKGKRDTLVIVTSVYVNKQWQAPVVASFSSAQGVWKDIDPLFSPDGKTVLFQSNRPSEKRNDKKRFDIWIATKTKNGWSDARLFDHTVNSDSSESYVSMARNGNVYYTLENGRHQGDIFLSEYKEGQYQTPQRLTTVINTVKRESNPFIAVDESYLLFATGKKTNDNDSDLFITFRKGNTWTSPINLGEAVNSSDSEFCPFIHTKEDRLYFTRLQRLPTGNIENEYYFEDFSKLVNELKKKSE